MCRVHPDFHCCPFAADAYRFPEVSFFGFGRRARGRRSRVVVHGTINNVIKRVIGFRSAVGGNVAAWDGETL